MSVLKWDTCQFCHKPILLWSNGKWYNAMSKSQCETNKTTHTPVTPVTKGKQTNYV